MKKILSLVLVLALALSVCTVFAAAEEQQYPAIFVVRGLNNKESKSENAKVKELIEEKSGVKFDVIVVPHDTWNEKVNALIASAEPMDLINITQDSGDWSKYLEKNAIQPYGDLLETYAPNMLAAARENAWRCCTAADGAVYALPRQESFTRGFTPVIRTDWLEMMGFEAPKTMEDLEAIFAKTIETDLNGNGIHDEIAYLPGYDSFITTFRPFFLGFSGERYLDENGVVLPWYMHPNCWKMLEKAQEWFEKGYIYPEYLTTTWEQITDIAAAGRILMFSGWYNDTVRPSKTIRDADPESKVAWAAVENLTDAPENSAWPTNPANQAELILSSTAREPEAALKLINWILDDVDNWMLCNYGIEGEHWEWVEEGKTFRRLEGATDKYYGLYFLTEWYAGDAPTEYVEEGDYVNEQLRDLKAEINAMDVVEDFDYYVPYTSAGTEVEMLINDAATLISEATAKATYGEYTEEDWNKVVDTCWKTDGQYRSKVWTEQYHAFVD